MPLNIRVLSVQQPWAWAIVHGGKDIENRQWRSHYRGPLAIHAGKRVMRADEKRVLRLSGRTSLPDEAWETGAIIGVVEMVDCVEKSRNKWFGGKFGFVVRHPTPCSKPVPLTGKLKIFGESVRNPGLIKVYLRVMRLSKARGKLHSLANLPRAR